MMLSYRNYLTGLLGLLVLSLGSCMPAKQSIKLPKNQVVEQVVQDSGSGLNPTETSNNTNSNGSNTPVPTPTPTPNPSTNLTLTTTTPDPTPTPTVEEAKPLTTLKQYLSSGQQLITQVYANGGWHAVYEIAVAVQAGDRLYIGSQTQLTVDSTKTIGQQYRITVNNKELGMRSNQINAKDGTHHMPMFAYAYYQATKTEKVVVRAEASAYHSGGNFILTIDGQNNGVKMGELFIEHYRSYASLSAAQADRAYGLNQIKEQKEQNVNTCCKAPYLQVPILIAPMQLQQDDLVRVTGQTIGVENNGFEMYTGVLSAGNQAISPYGGENVFTENRFHPLHLEGSYLASQDEKIDFQFRAYGGFNRGTGIYPGQNYLQLLVFRPLELESTKFQSLVEGMSLGNTQLSSFYSNQNKYYQIIKQDISLKAGEGLRLKAHVLLTQPSSASRVIECQIRSKLINRFGQQVSESFSIKNLTPTNRTIPLNTDSLIKIPADDNYSMLVQASCYSDAGTTQIAVDPTQNQLIVQRFAAF